MTGLKINYLNRKTIFFYNTCRQESVQILNFTVQWLVKNIS